MKNRTLQSGAVGMACRLLAVFTLLLTAIGANAESGDAVCAPLYVKSGAIQGASTCYANAWGNTPINLSNHYCVNEPTRIKRWCGMPPNLVQAEASCPVADPVNPGSGSTTLAENDFVSGDDTPVLFSRTYRSRALLRPDAGFGSSWFHNWQRQLDLAKVNSNQQVTAYREDGDAVTFGKSSGAWRPVDGKLFALVQGPSTWKLTDLTTGTVESYSLQGVLLSVSAHGGQVITLTYSDANTPRDVAPSSGLLIAITEHAPGANSFWDLVLRLGYDAKWRITQMTDPSGDVTQYGYDDYNNLVSVTWPDGNVRRYAYADTRFVSALTDVIDETGARISTWTYDAQGRATAVSHPDTTRNVWFAYGNGGTLVNYGQKSITMNFAPSGNMVRPTTTSSAAGTAGTTWDAAGNLLSQAGVSGINRSAVYDDAGRPTRAIHTGINGTTVTSVRYADGSSLRPAMIATPGRMRAFVYDSQSNLTGLSDWTTTDSTGASGFDASANGVEKVSYGLAYDSADQLSFAQVYDDGKLIEEWSLDRDLTGNLRQMYNRTSGTSYRVSVRDKAHRAIVIDSPGGSANPAYDSRGQLNFFSYDEPASPLNGHVHRFLKLNFGYSSDGRLVSRAGTVSVNTGPDTPVSSDEIDKWIANWNSGAVPVGPPVNLLGWVKALAANAEPPLSPVIAPWEAMFAAGRYAWSVFLLTREDPVVILVDKLKPEIEAKRCADVPPQLTLGELIGMLKDAPSTKGDFNLGEGTAADADALAQEFLGPDYRSSSRDDSILISKDGPYATTGVQANYQSRSVPSGQWQNNGHLNIRP
jgi:YD repeat-containing protein